MKTFLFHIFKTFRLIVVPIAKILSFIFVIVFLLTFFADDGQIPLSAKFMTFIFAVSLGAFAYYYDKLLLWLEPTSKQ